MGKWIALISTLLIPISVVFAKSDAIDFLGSKYVLGADFGISATTNSPLSTSFPVGYSTFSYHGGSNTGVPLRLGISLSKNLKLSTLNALQVGLSYHYISNVKVRGSLEQGIAPPYYSSTYAYLVNSQQFLAEAKLLHQWHDIFFPYLMGGVGGGFDRSSNYSTTVPEYLTITPYFKNKSTASFSYTVGLGVDYVIKPKLVVGFGYRFSDLGAVGLGQGTIRNRQIGSYITQSQLYLNTLLIELNWFF